MGQFDVIRTLTDGGLKYVVTVTIPSFEGEEMGKKTTEDYYKFFSQNWEQSERTLMDMVKKDKRTQELKVLYLKDVTPNSLKVMDSRIALMLYLILLQENKELEELRRFKEMFDVVEGKGAGFAFGLLRVMIDKMGAWFLRLEGNDVNEITDVLYEMREDRATLIELLKRAERVKNER